MAIRHPDIKFIGVDPSLNINLKNKILKDVPLSNLDLYEHIDHIPCKEQSIDAIFLMDVLEHIENDVAFVKTLLSNKIVKNETVFFITVPAYQSLFSSHDQLLNHYRRYNCKQLVRIANTTSMIIAQYGYFFSSLLVPRLLEVALEKRSIFNSKTETDLSKWQGAFLIDFLFKQILMYDFKISQFLRKFNITCPGLSCYMICQKKK